MRLTNRPYQDENLALHPHAGKTGLQALGELGLADPRKAGHVHGDSRLQSDRDQLNEVGKLHGRATDLTIARADGGHLSDTRFGLDTANAKTALGETAPGRAAHK